MIVGQTETKAHAELEKQKSGFAAGGTPSKYRDENKQRRTTRPTRKLKVRDSLARLRSRLLGTSADALAHGMAVPVDGGSDLATVVIESDGESPFDPFDGAQEIGMRDEESKASVCTGVPMHQRWDDDF